MNKPLTNIQLVDNLMTHSPHGAMCQAFVVEAIRHYSEMVVKSPRPEPDEKAVLNPALWWDIGADIHTRVNDYLGVKVQDENAEQE